MTQEFRAAFTSKRHLTRTTPKGCGAGMARRSGCGGRPVVDRARRIVNGYALMKVTLGARSAHRHGLRGDAAASTAPIPASVRAAGQGGPPGGPVPRPDRHRPGEIHVPPAWTGVDAFVAEMPGWFRLRPHLEGQEHACTSRRRSDTLRQQLIGWLCSTRVSWSWWSAASARSRTPTSSTTASPPTSRDAASPGGRGDFDLLRRDIEVDWVARTGCCEPHRAGAADLRPTSSAYELPATEGKRGDPRWRRPRRPLRFPDPRRPVQWEVEALEPAELQRLVPAAGPPRTSDRDVLARAGRPQGNSSAAPFRRSVGR
ncbi:hypothetical protein LV779_33945 [Streptomyces thinghirensis]|nr:hypothetical protein [Streptomyces thinghirensis]